MNNKWNINFLQNVRQVQKVSRLKLYLQKQTINEILIICESFEIYIYPCWLSSESSIGQSTLFDGV